MSEMDHEKLAQRLEHRLDKIEEKLDLYLNMSHAQEADLRWVKGYIRISLTAMITLGAGLIAALFKAFTGTV